MLSFVRCGLRGARVFGVWSSAGTSPPKANAEPSAYCRSAAQALFQGGDHTEIAAVTRACRRGDIIVRRLRDFSKSVVVMGQQTLCVLTAERSVR